MGNTCTSVHIAWRGPLEEAVKVVWRAYSKLGYELTKAPQSEVDKHVIFRTDPGENFVSVYDSNNAKLDSGELKDMALVASKLLKTTTIFTSLNDSDSFEFIVFANGKQIDLVMTDAESYEGPHKRLSDKSRAVQWSKLFGETLTVSDIKQAIDTNTAFADDTLARLCRLAGITDNQAQLPYQDFASQQETISAQCYLAKQQSVSSTIPDGQVTLSNLFDADANKMLMVYPASWPIPVGKERKTTWSILSQGAGFSGGKLSIRVLGPDGLTLPTGSVSGFKFHNGQIVGGLDSPPKNASHEEVQKFLESKRFEVVATGVEEETGTRSFMAIMPNLVIPPFTTQSTSQILIVLQLDLIAEKQGEWQIEVSFEPQSPTKFRYNLPKVRIAAVDKNWLPIVSGLNAKAFYDTSDLGEHSHGALMQKELTYKQSSIQDDRNLDHFAVASNVAILSGDEQTSLDAGRSLIESWLRPLLSKQSGELRILAEKRMTESAYVGRSKKSLSAATFIDDKAWKKLFEFASNYQTVLATFYPSGADYPIAGIGLQCTLEDSGKHRGPHKDYYEQSMANTLSKMRGRAFEKVEHSNTLHVFTWVLNHEDCFEYLQTSVSDMKKRIDDFAAAHSPLQAWYNESTWIPRFDQADNYHLTVYEDSSVLNWFRGILDSDGGLNDRKMSLQWCSNVLRMVTPQMWLCRQLIEQVDMAGLERVAMVTQANGVYKVTLRQEFALDDLELALLPILPLESARVHTKSILT
ncbi:hypothetical protein KA183_21330 [bacterium]|nr:hypothetical protein [bacterium]